MKDIQWNKIMLREFESLSCLSEEEITVSVGNVASGFLVNNILKVTTAS